MQIIHYNFLKIKKHALVLNLLGAVHETEGNLTDALDYH